MFSQLTFFYYAQIKDDDMRWIRRTDENSHGDLVRKHGRKKPFRIPRKEICLQET